MVTEKRTRQNLDVRLAAVDVRLAVLGVEPSRKLPGAAAGLAPRPRLTVATARRRLARWSEGVTNATSILKPLPGPRETLHCLMDGTFTGWQVAAGLLELTGPWHALYVCTLGFNSENTTALLAALDAGCIGRTLFAASEYFRETDPGTFESLQRQLVDRGHRVFAGRLHAKLILAQDASGRFWTIESSANLRSCQSVEQFTLSQSRPLYRFHAHWLEEAYKRATKP